MLSSPYEYRELSKNTNNETGFRRYNTPDGEKLPSVTTILSKTADPEEGDGLQAWIDWVGVKKAEQIRDEAGNRGTVMHRRLEWYVKGIEKKVGGNLIQQQGYNMSKVIIEHGLKHMTEFWGSEISLWYPGLYAGTTDLVGVWKGKPAIVDFKQANKLKKPEHILGYKTQLTAYAMAHNEVYGTDIQTGVILVCTKDLEYQEFVVEGDEFGAFTNKWLDRLESYYQQN
jgi:genome maintenance exonuclease 1